MSAKGIVVLAEGSRETRGVDEHSEARSVDPLLQPSFAPSHEFL